MIRTAVAACSPTTIPTSTSPSSTRAPRTRPVRPSPTSSRATHVWCTCTPSRPASRAPTTRRRAHHGRHARLHRRRLHAPTDWLSTIVTAFEADDEADLLYGQVVPARLDDDSAVLTPLLKIDKPQRLGRDHRFRVFGMGANFAARRRLFDRIGGFDEILGGGGPLKSSQDYDLAYRTYKAGSVIALRPEIAIRHDGRREHADWPELLKNYGIGDGAFYSKHVRCRDPFALWLLVRQWGGGSAKYAVKLVLRRKPEEGPYLAGIFVGIRNSFKFRVDRRARLYVER